MRKPISIYLTMAVGMSIVAAFSRSASAQVPEPSSVPRLAVPARGAVATPQDQAAPAAAPTEPAPVTAAPPPSGVTQVPPPAAPPATASSSAAATATTATGKDRGYSAAIFALSLDGANVPLVAVEGGAVVGEVVVANLGPDNIRKKHVGGIKFEEFSFDIGFTSKPVLDWITSTWQGKQSRKSGSVQVADFNRKVVAERHFRDALITGTTIPTLDGGSKQAAYLRVTVAPEEIREMAGSGDVAKSPNKDKAWLVSNFRFELGDLPGKRVARIESFTVGQKVAEDQVGEFREVQKQAGTLEFPNLKVTLSAADAEPWAKWHDEFLVKGNNGDAQEKNGAIVFLGPNMQDELGRVNLFNCGIFRFGAPRREANAATVARVTADLYCERMELVMNAVK